MNLARLVLAVGISLLAVSCASKKPSYRTVNGETVPSVDQYGYGAGELSPAAAPASPGLVSPQDLPWPKTFLSGTTTNVIYQPQIESWDGSAVVARNAVAVQPEGQPQAIYGVIQVRATTSVDRTNGTVTLLNLQVTDGEFPSAPERKEEFLKGIRERYPDGLQMVSLAALENAIAANQQHAKAVEQPLQNTPPKILATSRPTVLVNIDGTPVYQNIDGTDFDRVVNTRVLLMRDKDSKHYLHVLDGYLGAAALEGPWSYTEPPRGAANAEKYARENGLDLLEPAVAGGRAVLTSTNVPDVHIATSPTELITFDGEPDYIPVPGTQLLYVTNTTANVFKSLKDQQTYALLSGRWFKAPGLQGPWEFVPAAQLPSDFAQIPDNSPKENVKASIPGTTQAKEAVIANSIPTSTGVRRGAAMAAPQIDGPPRLEPIGGTPLYYVVNSGTPIIKVDDQSWYACQDGVWYVATSVEGPWVAADSVPAVIYSIPPSSPMHYVTYVRVYDSSPSVIYQGYTPGYLGTVVSSDAVVVYGTGYYYSPWVGHYWYGGPVTWGMGWGPFWSPWTSWSYGYGFGWSYWGYYPYYYNHHHHHHDYYACRPASPYWGPYRKYAPPALSPYRPAGVNTAANVYQRPVRPQTMRNAPERMRPNSLAAGYNSRTGRMVAGQRAEVDNVFRAQPGTLPSGPVRTTTRTTTAYTGGVRGIRGGGAMERDAFDNPQGGVPVIQRSGGAERTRSERMSAPERSGAPARDMSPAPRINRIETIRAPERSPSPAPPGIEQRRRR